MELKRTGEQVVGTTGVVGKGTGYRLDEGGLAPHVVKENPIFEKDGKWYFWDETWANSYGPFDTEEIARKKFEKYSELMG